ncbi:hypothetical protein MWN33_01265 [Starkeya koreensis]|uniref:Uncharacterized protein n=1 Tax=Ancylobacter koreensis TaxID=266121 RepID=A0ABT0DHB3_9HYPH|nr:hypothetical protein [Ancylobacter koreensis]MCK0206660.1 hypothetical protein [Ancylobacter koreensis]
MRMKRKASAQRSGLKRAAVSGKFRFRALTPAGLARGALLAGTALMTCVVVVQPTPARAVPLSGCTITNAPGMAPLDYWNAVCQGEISGKDAQYKSGKAPTTGSDKTFDNDFHLTAPEVDGSDNTVYNYFNGEGVSIEDDKGYDIEVEIGDTSAIESTKTGIAVKTGTKDANLGNISIESGAYIEASKGDGITAESKDGDIVIVNTGIVGVIFADKLSLKDNQFYVDTTPVDLEVGEAFTIGQVKGTGIKATSKSGDITIWNGVLDEMTSKIVETGAIYAKEDGISAKNESGAGVIDIFNAGDIYADKNGISVETGKDSTGHTDIYNFGHIEADKTGIAVKAEGSGSVDIYNASSETIIAARTAFPSTATGP